MKTKVCTSCDKEHPHSEFHRNRAAPDGLRAECKPCACARRRTYYDANLRQLHDSGPRTATCHWRECGEEFSYERTTGPLRMYCSDRHRYLAGDWQKRERAPEHVRRCPCGSVEVARVGKPVCPSCRKDPRTNDSNRLRERRRTLRIYGLTQTDWDGMVAKQGDRCATCRTDTPGGRGESWCVDHDHACCPGKGSCGRCVRGLVCSSCNVAMGYAGDDPARLRAMADYIEAARQPALFAAA